MELLPHVLRLGGSHPELTQNPEHALRVVRVLLVQPPGALRVPEGHDNKQKTDGDLEHVGHAPGDVVGRRVEGHAVAGPKGDQRAELVPELRDRADEGAAEGLGGALGHVEAAGDVDAAEAETSGGRDGSLARFERLSGLVGRLT
jgi:hypothetical protein